MAYTPSTFVDDDTAIPLDAFQLGKLGGGIALAQSVGELAATKAAGVGSTASRIVTDLASFLTVHRSSDSAAVTTTTPAADDVLTTTLTGVCGNRVGVTVRLLFRGDFSGSPAVKLGLSAVNGAYDVTGHMYVGARDDFGAEVPLDPSGQAYASVPLLSGTTAGTAPADVHYLYAFASLLVGASTGDVTVSVIRAQAQSGTGLKILKGSCLTAELLT